MYPSSKTEALLEQLEAEAAIRDLTAAAYTLWLPVLQAEVFPPLTAAAPRPPDPAGAGRAAGWWRLILDNLLIPGIGYIWAYQTIRSYLRLRGVPAGRITDVIRDEFPAEIPAAPAAAEPLTGRPQPAEPAGDEPRRDNSAPPSLPQAPQTEPEPEPSQLTPSGPRPDIPPGEPGPTEMRATARTIVTRNLALPPDTVPTLEQRLAALPTIRELQNQYLAQVHNRMVNTPDWVFRDIAHEIDTGLAAGESPQDIATRVQQYLGTETGDWPGRALTVARTETAGAMSSATMQAAQLRNTELSEDLQQIWLCVHPDTVTSASGVIAMARRNYEGPMVKLVTAAGRSVTVTPEHRVLTGRGWVQAQLVDKSDHLISVPGCDTPMAPDVKGIPPTVGQVVDSCMAAMPVEVRSVSSRVDLNGQRIHGDIEVVRTNVDLLDGVISSSREQVKNLLLTPADILAKSVILGSSHICDGPEGLVASSIGGTHLCVGGRLREIRGSSGPEDPSGALISDGDSSGLQSILDNAGSCAELSGQPSHGNPSEITRDNGGAIQVFARVGHGSEALGGTTLLDSGGRHEESVSFGSAKQDSCGSQSAADGFCRCLNAINDHLSGGLPGSIAADQVIDIEWDHFVGHVYDLQTVGGWFSANGLVAHNCTLDNHTRDTHFAADGQRVPLGTQFTVGNAQLRFPGDPSGPADLVINCRCRLAVLAADEPLPVEHGAGRAAEVQRRAAEGVIRARDDDGGTGSIAAAAPDATMATQNQEGNPMPDIRAELTALLDRLDEPAAADAGMEQFRSFTAVLALIGTPTDDGRLFANTIDFRFREFPLPLMWQRQSEPGHYSSFTVGAIESATVQGSQIIGEGYLLNTPEADEAAEQIGHKVVGPSVDLGDVTWILTDKNGKEISEEDWWDNPDMEVTETVTSAKLLGATLVATPAFEGTSVTIGEFVARTLTAAAAVAQAPVFTAPKYPDEFFSDPGFTEPTLPHITEDGRIQGHLASFNTCHVGIQDRCVMAPHSTTGYAHFHTAPPVLTDSGQRVKVGRLTVGGGHAAAHLRLGPAVAHYDDAGTCFALVHVGEDEHGIWFSGVPAPGATPEQISQGLAAPLSGDWRNSGGNLELVAALAVNTPGFPIIASGATDDNQDTVSLVASLGPCRDTSTSSGLTAEQMKRFAILVVSEMRAAERRTTEARMLLAAQERRTAALALLKEV